MMRIAFYGRTADGHGAEGCLTEQREACERILNPGEQITVVFFDVGHGDLPDGFGLERDGSMTDLLHEAREPGRRFDIVIARSRDRLEHGRDNFGAVLLRLTAAGVPVRVGKRQLKRTAGV